MRFEILKICKSIIAHRAAKIVIKAMALSPETGLFKSIFVELNPIRMMDKTLNIIVKIFIII